MSEWVSIANRVPDDNRWVFTYGKTDYVRRNFFLKKENRFMFEPKKITHWHEINLPSCEIKYPEPPKETE